MLANHSATFLGKKGERCGCALVFCVCHDTGGRVEGNARTGGGGYLGSRVGAGLMDRR